MVARAAQPMVLGRYEVHAAIAHGGMASVHLGRVLGAAGFARVVAVKRLHPHFASDASFVAMFTDEARLVARIQHPNVVPIVDVVSEGDELFLVMEYVHGESLARLVHDDERSAPVPPAIAAAIFAGVLHGLHASHEATSADGEPLAIVHRDVTPHNVLVGVDGVARIADFGIAKATQRSQQTAQGQLKGKLCYVAPEQLQGTEADRTTDVYAAAVSLWEALTGTILFDAEHEARIVEKVLVGATRPPSALVKEIPPALDEVVMRGLEMRPHKRFPTARDMAHALEGALGVAPASTVGAWVESRAVRALTARRALIAQIERAAREPPAPPAPPAAHNPTQNALNATTDVDAIAGVPRRGLAARAAAALAFLALFVLVAAATLAALTGWRARHPRLASPSPSAPADAAPAADSDAGSASASASDSDSDAGSASASDSGSASASSRARRPLRGKPASAAPVAPPAARDAGVDCTMPYTRDATGAKVYRRECL